jgi:hypothetical protein
MHMPTWPFLPSPGRRRLGVLLIAIRTYRLDASIPRISTIHDQGDGSRGMSTDAVAVLGFRALLR